MFNFFLHSYRKGLLTFCGSRVNVEFDINESEGRNTFRKFDNGQFKDKPIISRHPNIVKAVIIGKKSWGLFVNEWSDGIVDGDFMLKEIIQDFTNKGITIPESLLLDFENRISTKFRKKHLYKSD